ncbi:MAG: hypothetical protein ACTSV7_04495 [Candidatus Baldrarchaeia archaeon]
MSKTRKRKKKTNGQKLAESKWNTRKLVGFALLYFGALALCFADKATGEQVFWFWAWIFGIYITGNVGAKLVSPIKLGQMRNRILNRSGIIENDNDTLYTNPEK